VLYGLCQRYPDHSTIEGTYAKVWIISRTYATGIERHVRDKTSSALDVLIRFLHAHRRVLDGIILALSKVREPLTDEALETVVLEHGRLVSLLRPKMRKQNTPRSFAAKYLHFHIPAVPIYDNVAAKNLKKLCPLAKEMKVFACPQGGDAEYYKYVLRFRELYLAALRDGYSPTVRGVDYYLWYAPH